MKISEYRELMRRAKTKRRRVKAKAAGPAKRPVARTGTEALFERLHLAPRQRPYTFQPPPLTITKIKMRRYTPDYRTELDDGREMLIEVKGSYRLQSHERARLAWEIAAESNPQTVFVWAAKSPKTGRFEMEIWEGGGASVAHASTLPN